MSLTTVSISTDMTSSILWARADPDGGSTGTFSFTDPDGNGLVYLEDTEATDSR
jgi:hypothetical protein